MPLETLAVEVGNAVGREVGDLDAYFVVASLEPLLTIEDKGD